ncbi:hypothetical protein DFH06DRAFT_1078842, partial [Mycena polygramma]
MPPIRDHQILYKFLGDEDDEREAIRDGLLPAEWEDEDEDDMDMPPLVDAPRLPSPIPAETQTPTDPARPTQESMMSSFDLTNVTFPGAPFAPTLIYDGQPGASDSFEDGGQGGSGRGSKAHNKRAPSYIPRPPNAFILFRSSFIRSQNVPGRVEGNHSTLSKIIGRYWHALPPAERARWEDKARAAQAEHRRRYPDWRFRPGNGKNAYASGSGSAKEKPKGRRKGRIKDGGGGDDPHTQLQPEASTSGAGNDAQDDGDEQRGRAVRGKAKDKGKGKEKAGDVKG